ncbi:MAG: hypothetical protein WC649_00455 [Desulfobacteria bacterium]
MILKKYLALLFPYKEKEAMKGEMERRLVYGSADFVKDMATNYNISEKIKAILDRQFWVILGTQYLIMEST